MSVSRFSDKKRIMNKFITEKLILASQSPRRKQLLEQLGLKIMIAPASIDESNVSTQVPDLHVKELASLKARDIGKSSPDSWVIGADTIVVIKNQILGKPSSREEAVSMLCTLSGKEHHVYTGFCITCTSKQTEITKAVKTTVKFKKLSEAEINWYADTGEPFDKAGAYGVQGIGAFLVREIKGSYSNVVGLPVCEVFETLTNLNLINLKPDNINTIS